MFRGCPYWLGLALLTDSSGEVCDLIKRSISRSNQASILFRYFVIIVSIKMANGPVRAKPFALSRFTKYAWLLAKALMDKIGGVLLAHFMRPLTSELNKTSSGSLGFVARARRCMGWTKRPSTQKGRRLMNVLAPALAWSTLSLSHVRTSPAKVASSFQGSYIRSKNALQTPIFVLSQKQTRHLTCSLDTFVLYVYVHMYA